MKMSRWGLCALVVLVTPVAADAFCVASWRHLSASRRSRAFCDFAWISPAK